MTKLYNLLDSEQKEKIKNYRKKLKKKELKNKFKIFKK